MTETPTLTLPAIDPETVEAKRGANYSDEFAGPVKDREKRALGDALGLGQFGVNLVTMEPGALSSLRHWHSGEEEFVWVVSGELVLVQDGGETVLRAGDAAAFKAGGPDGHHLRNRSGAVASFLVIGTRAASDTCTYPDVDLINRTEGARNWFTLRDGTFVKEAS